jgi:hypothetical protein
MKRKPKSNAKVLEQKTYQFLDQSYRVKHVKFLNKCHTVFKTSQMAGWKVLKALEEF